MYQKFVPLGILVFLVALVGFVFHIALQTAAQCRRYAVFYLCGMHWRKASQLSALSLGALLLCALSVCGLILFLSVRLSWAAQFGLLFQPSNLYVTLGMLGISFLTALIVPYIQMKHTTPVTLIRRNER